MKDVTSPTFLRLAFLIGRFFSTSTLAMEKVPACWTQETSEHALTATPFLAQLLHSKKVLGSNPQTDVCVFSLCSTYFLGLLSMTTFLKTMCTMLFLKPEGGILVSLNTLLRVNMEVTGIKNLSHVFFVFMFMP